MAIRRSLDRKSLSRLAFPNHLNEQMGLPQRAPLFVDSPSRAGYSTPNDSRPAGEQSGLLFPSKLSCPKTDKHAKPIPIDFGLLACNLCGQESQQSGVQEGW